MEIPYCPVVRPTLKQFQNFREFVEKLDRTYKKEYGIVKVKIITRGYTSNFIFQICLSQVIPPPEWKARKSDYGPAFHDLNINGPIEQNLYGKGGVYECLHIAKKSMSFD